MTVLGAFERSKNGSQNQGFLSKNLLVCSGIMTVSAADMMFEWFI
jgi:hypothetical protein